MTKTSLGKVTNSGSYEYTNAGAAITKTNYGRIAGAISPYDFYNSAVNQENQKFYNLNNLSKQLNKLFIIQIHQQIHMEINMIKIISNGKNTLFFLYNIIIYFKNF